MKKRYRFNFRKFVHKVIAPMQFVIGLLLLFGAGGTEGLWQALVLAAGGAVLMGLTTLYR